MRKLRLLLTQSRRRPRTRNSRQQPRAGKRPPLLPARRLGRPRRACSSPRRKMRKRSPLLPMRNLGRPRQARTCSSRQQPTARTWRPMVPTRNLRRRHPLRSNRHIPSPWRHPRVRTCGRNQTRSSRLTLRARDRRQTSQKTSDSWTTNSPTSGKSRLEPQAPNRGRRHQARPPRRHQTRAHQLMRQIRRRREREPATVRLLGRQRSQDRRRRVESPRRARRPRPTTRTLGWLRTRDRRSPCR
jgi:hypothetical protein